MRHKHCKAIAILTALLLLLCLPIPSALAASATSVLVNGVTLTSAAPYWANGAAAASTAAPASGGYIYFNQAAGTLTLKDAVVSTTTFFPLSTTEVCSIFVDGDIDVILVGSSTLSFTTGNALFNAGLVAAGTLTISGDGSLNVQLSNTGLGGLMYGVYCNGKLKVFSGTITMNISDSTAASGMGAMDDVVIAGGTIQIQTTAMASVGLETIFGDIRITGGSITAKAIATGTYASALYGDSIYLEGGTGRFEGTSGTPGTGAGFGGDDFNYSGGVFYFIGPTAGIVYDSILFLSYTFSAPAGTVFVSRNLDGSDLKPWTSDAVDGLLIPLFIDTDPHFLYVRFGTPEPHTGDESRPWLWAGVAGMCGLLGTGIAAGTLRRQKERKVG